MLTNGQPVQELNTSEWCLRDCQTFSIILFCMAFSWTLLSILAMEALNDTREEKIMMCSTCASDQVLCNLSSLCLQSHPDPFHLLLTLFLFLSNVGLQLWECYLYMCVYTGRFNWAASQWKGKKTRALNDINFTAIHDHALMKKDRGEEADFSEKNHSLPCCALSASQPVLWAAQHRPTSLGTLSPIVTNTTFKAIRLLHDLHV